MALPADHDPTAWHLIDKTTGHRYVLKMFPSREAAQALAWLRKRLWTLHYDVEHAKTLEERAAKLSEFTTTSKKLEAAGRVLMHDCLGDQIDGLPEAQQWDLFASMINYFEKEGPSEIE